MQMQRSNQQVFLIRLSTLGNIRSCILCLWTWTIWFSDVSNPCRMCPDFPGNRKLSLLCGSFAHKLGVSLLKYVNQLSLLFYFYHNDIQLVSGYCLLYCRSSNRARLF